MNTQQCSHCHNILKADARFCRHCGQPISEKREGAQEQQQQAASLNFVRFQEQREGAYTLKMPQGWKVSAAIQQLADAAALPTWEMSDPSGTVSMAAPGLHFSFQEPAFGYFGAPLPGRTWMRYMPAPLFIQQVTLPRLRRQNAAARVERITEHPELVAEMVRQYTALGENPAYAKFSVASVEFVFQQQGKTYRQKTYISVIYVPSIHCWWADVIGLVCAPIDQFAQYEPLLKTVVFSLQWNAQWLQARNARLQMLAAQYMQQGLMSQQMAQVQMLQGQRMVMETGNIIRAGQERQMAAQERNFNAWDNIVAGNIDLKAPDGQVYNVANDFQPRHWIDALGQVHGGGWNVQPDPYWTPLSPDD